MLKRIRLKIALSLLIGILSVSRIPINLIGDAAAKNGKTSQQGLWHTVRRGETLWDLAQHYQTTIMNLKRANPLRSTRLRAGQKLFIPEATKPEKGTGFWHRVKPGESVWELARRYQVSERTLCQLNVLVTGQVQVGQRVFIPKSQPKPRPKRASQMMPLPSQNPPLPTHPQPLHRRGGGRGRTTTPKLISPLAQKTVITDGYGSRQRHPVTGRPSFHHGVDLRAPVGTPVFAVRAGTVTFAGWRGGYGQFVVIQHAKGFSTAYGHLKRIDVHAGKKVKQGDIIGLSGDSGSTTGPHLHFESWSQGVSTDPQRYIRF